MKYYVKITNVTACHMLNIEEGYYRVHYIYARKPLTWWRCMKLKIPHTVTVNPGETAKEAITNEIKDNYDYWVTQQAKNTLLDHTRRELMGTKFEVEIQ